MNFIPNFNNLFLYPKSNKQTTGGIGANIGFTILPLDGIIGLGAALTILRLPPRELMVSKIGRAAVGLVFVLIV